MVTVEVWKAGRDLRIVDKTLIHHQWASIESAIRCTANSKGAGEAIITI
jgi:hypothetical protein